MICPLHVWNKLNIINIYNEAAMMLSAACVVQPFRMDFSGDPEKNIQKTFQLLKRREMVKPNDLVIVVSDLRQAAQSTLERIMIGSRASLTKEGSKEDPYHQKGSAVSGILCMQA